jgi:hypothetical protein
MALLNILLIEDRAAKLPGAGKIEEMTDAPGGGHRITVFDPENLPTTLVYGQR